MARKILLADDSVTAQNMGRKILADAGYEVITVNNGSAALKKIAEHKPDLIVLDVYMPGYSGLEVCQRLKEAQETARTPVLLTVGKLEPFKPDEAKRVGADSYIVKPFEASELLSALSKLEDKIVPRSESSKPGRFARAIASVEELGRFGKNAPSDEETGWKIRIAFPPKNKEKAEEEENGDDPAIYNAMNRDLRTVVDPAHEKETIASVTTEERRKESRRKEDDSGQERRVDVSALASPGMPKDVTPEEIAAIAAAAAQVQATASSARDLSELSTRRQIAVPADRAVEAQVANAIEEGMQAAPVTPADRVADQTKNREEDRQEDRQNEDQKEEAVAVPANPADLIAALASLEPVNGHSWQAVQPGKHSENYSEDTVDVPVTMAVASIAAAGLTASRWTVVPMAMDPDEAVVSLELEMQKAYAAFAAAEEPHRQDDSSVATTVATEISQPTSVGEPGSVVSTPEPELTEALKEVTSTAADAVGAAIAELAAVAQSYCEIQPQAQPIPADVTDESSSNNENSTRATEFVSAHGSAVAEPVQPEDQTTRTLDQAVPDEVGVMAETAPVESAVGSLANMAEKKESDLVATTAAAWASWRQIRETGSPSGNSARPAKVDEQQDEHDEPAHSPESSAMAVAAGAEKSPEEAAAASSAESKAIANIVDSVLAELRPKIAEEIARKLSAEKK